MNRSLQTYTPRVLPLEYDALALAIGCQDVPEGHDLFYTKAFDRVCIFEHDSESLLFNQPDTVTYANGPIHTGDPFPWPARWAAYVSVGGGVYIVKRARVDLPSSAGSKSTLFPTEKPTDLAIGFMPNGQMAIAIQKTKTEIQIKWFKDGTGFIESIGDVSFPGVSPVLFQNGLVHNGDDEGETDLVLYYLRPSTPSTLYARIGREHFVIEHIVNDFLPIRLTNLIETTVEGRKQALYAKEFFGRDVTLYSPEYVVSADDDNASVEVSVFSGKYKEQAIPANLNEDTASFSLEITEGRYYDPLVPVPPPDTEHSQLEISIISGEYI